MRRLIPSWIACACAVACGSGADAPRGQIEPATPPGEDAGTRVTPEQQEAGVEDAAGGCATKDQRLDRDPGWEILEARFASANTLIYSARASSGASTAFAFFQVDLCTGVRSKLTSFDGPGHFALDASGALLFFQPGGGSNHLVRRQGGTTSPVTSACDWAYPDGIDVAGPRALVNNFASSRTVWTLSLQSAACDSSRVNRAELNMNADALPARLSPDGTKILLASSGPRPGCFVSNTDLALFEVATKSMTPIAFSTSSSDPCQDAGPGPFGWYPDSKRVLVARLGGLFSLDTGSGAVASVNAPAVTGSRIDPRWVEVSPDGKLAAVVDQAGEGNVVVLP